MCQRNRLCDFWLRLSQAVSIFASKCRFLLHLDPETPQSRLSGNRRGSGVARIFRPCYTAVIYIEMIFQRTSYKVLTTSKSNPVICMMVSASIPISFIFCAFCNIATFFPSSIPSAMPSIRPSARPSASPWVVPAANLLRVRVSRQNRLCCSSRSYSSVNFRILSIRMPHLTSVLFICL